MLLDAALAALRYHPTPSMILSGSKTVLMANEAMGRLLEAESGESGSSESDEDEKDEPPGGGILGGQTLSQMGIAMAPEEEQTWGTWGVGLYGRSKDHSG